MANLAFKLVFANPILGQRETFKRDLPVLMFTASIENSAGIITGRTSRENTAVAHL